MESGRPRLMAQVAMVAAWVQGLFPVRVMNRFGELRGAVLASGLAYQALFAVTAGLWVGFAVAGIVFVGNPALRDALLEVLSTSLPGLLDDGSGSGVVDPDDLLSAQILGWTGAVAAVGLLWTGLNWLDSARRSVRQMFDARPVSTPFLLLKLKDLGFAVAFGTAVLLSAALLVASTAALGWIYDLLGLPGDTRVAQALTRVVGLLLMFLLDSAVIAALYRVLSGLRIPPRRLASGALLVAAAIGLLKVLGTALLDGASRNPLLASFAVLLGLLIWLNLICQVLLIGAAWIAVGMADHALVADPAVAAERAEQERRLRAEAEREARRMVPRWLRWAVRDGTRRARRRERT